MPGSHQAQLANKQLMVLNVVSYSQGLLLIHTCAQAVIGCFSGQNAHENIAKIQKSQWLQALEYFNLPKSMWPLGLCITQTQRLKCDKVAKRMMDTIKADFSRMAKQDTLCAATFTQCYSVYKSEQGMYLTAESRPDARVRSISEPLRCRLRDLAAAQCLAIEFFQRNVSDRVSVSLSC